MDLLKPPASDRRIGRGRAWNRWKGHTRGAWRGLGLLVVAVLLPFGWLLPIAQLAHARATRRHPGHRSR